MARGRSEMGEEEGWGGDLGGGGGGRERGRGGGGRVTVDTELKISLLKTRGGSTAARDPQGWRAAVAVVVVVVVVVFPI